MRIVSLVLLGALGALCVPAQEFDSSVRLQPRAQIQNGPRSKVSMYIWSDKYTYTAGESLTLKWTVKTNGDLYPYTVFVYRQNNQTGAKNFLPNGGETPTDFTGASLAAGYAPAALTDVTKQVLIGSGGKFAAIAMPNELGMHTIVVQLRDYTGTRVLKTSYMKVGVVKGDTTLPNSITTDTTLTNDTRWHVSGITYVKNGATLTVEPGTFVIGEPGTPTAPSVLVISQNGKIIANGTQSRPIVMTSSKPFGDRVRGDWGGLVMLGKAPINVGANIPAGTGICTVQNPCNNAAGSFFIEGLVGNADSTYGGTDSNYSCGSLKYVRVEYAGSTLSQNNELNSFTWGGCGKATGADHLQAIYGKDDCFEWFGGTMDAKYLVGGNCADDYTDFQLGYTGRVQYGLMYQSPDSNGNRGVEGDNSEYDNAATPFSNPTFYNITYYGSGIVGLDESASPGLYLRRGARGTFNNLAFMNFFSQCTNISDATTQAQADAGNVKMNGILCYNDNKGATNFANTLAGQFPAAATYDLQFAQGQKGNGAGKNFVVADPLAVRPTEYSDPDFAGQAGSPLFQAGWVAAPDDGFFDQSAKFIGGIGDVDWTEEWTSFIQDQDIK